MRLPCLPRRQPLSPWGESGFVGVLELGFGVVPDCPPQAFIPRTNARRARAEGSHPQIFRARRNATAAAENRARPSAACLLSPTC